MIASPCARDLADPVRAPRLSEPERDHETTTRLGHIVEASLNEIYVFAADTLRLTIVNRSAAANSEGEEYGLYFRFEM